MTGWDGQVVYSVSMSLDGFIAGPGGDMSWLAPHLGDGAPGLDDFAASVGAMLVGRRTFGGDDPNRGTDAEGAFGGTWSGPVVVLTHDPPATAVDDVTFVSDLRTALDAARAAAGSGCVNVLGADVAGQLLVAGELDQVVTVVVPVLLGDGTRLFGVPGGHEVALEPLDVATAPHATTLRYRVRRPEAT